MRLLTIVALSFWISNSAAQNACIRGNGFEQSCECVPAMVELCDQMDNTCEGDVDEFCVALTVENLPPMGCPGIINGGMLAVGNDGKVFIAEFPGNGTLPGKLHILQRNGTFNLNANIALPDGARAIERSASGRIFVAGSQTNPTFEHQVFELNPDTGANLVPAYFQELWADTIGFYINDIAVNGADEVFLGAQSGTKIYRVEGTGLVEYATGFGNNDDMIFGLDGTTLFVASGTKFGKVTAGGGFTELYSYSGFSGPSLARDLAGNLYLSVSSDCEFNCGPPLGLVFRFNPDGAEPLQFLTSSYDLKGIAYDPMFKDLLIYSTAANSLVTGCTGAPGTVFKIHLP